MIPLATTTVTIVETAGDPDADPYEPTPTNTLATGVRAVIGSPSGADLRVGGDKEIVDAAAQLDLGVAVTHTCRLIDESTGDRWSVVWVRTRIGLGLDHQRCGLVAVKGGVSG